jgi:hypothetical protein
MWFMYLYLNRTYKMVDIDWAEAFLAKHSHIEEFDKLPEDAQNFFGSGGGLSKVTKAVLMAKARELGIKGRSKMNKAQLMKALY